MQMALTVNDFLSREKPKGGGVRRSRLAPFDRDLRKLKKEGYSLEQMREFLQANDVQVTVAGISAYLNKSVQAKGSTASAGRRATR